MDFIFLLTIAYLIGSIPTAVWVGKRFYGVDVREYGSGNAGTTNTLRTLGKNAAIFVLLVDMLKGWAAVQLSRLSFYDWGSEDIVNLQIALGLCAILGHIFPIWAGFKGGKGVATLFGMILAIHPIVAVSLVGVFLFMLLITHYVSLSSISASIAFPILILFIFKDQAPEIAYKIFAIATACMVVMTHHKNIGRLLTGNESKIKLIKKKEE